MTTAWVNPDKTFGEQADRVSKFYDLVGRVRDTYGKGGTDARGVNLNNVAMAANAAMTTLRLWDWARRGGSVMFIEALSVIKPEYLEPIAEDHLRAARLHLLVETQFQLEALYRNILLALGEPEPKGFYNVARDVLAATGVAHPDRKLEILNIPALTRNSEHTNGIYHGHKGQSTFVMIKGVEFRFEHGKRVQCGSWLHIVTVLMAVMEIVEEILASPKVAALPDIPDGYAVAVAAKH